MINAKCHCGNVELSFQQLPESYTVCNCSICRRYGARWLYFSNSEVVVKEKIPTKKYIWGDKIIAFHHCPICGCVTHYKGLPDSGFDRLAVNANLLSADLYKNLKVRRFDGASM